MVSFCEASVSAQSSTNMRVFRSVSLLLGIRGKALDVESSTQGPWEGSELQPSGALCVGPQRSLRQGPALSASWGAALSVSGPGAVGARHSLCRAPRSLCRGPALFVSGPGALCVRVALSVSSLASHGPQLRFVCHPFSPARSLFPGENPKPYCLGENNIPNG